MTTNSQNAAESPYARVKLADDAIVLMPVDAEDSERVLNSTRYIQWVIPDCIGNVGTIEVSQLETSTVISGQYNDKFYVAVRQAFSEYHNKTVAYKILNHDLIFAIAHRLTSDIPFQLYKEMYL